MGPPIHCMVGEEIVSLYFVEHHSRGDIPIGTDQKEPNPIGQSQTN